MGGDKIVLLDGAGANGGGAATNGLLSMIPGMFANLIGGNKMDPNLVAALMNGRNNQDGFGGANGWWLWIIVLFWLWGGRGFGNGFGNGGDCCANGLPAQLNNDYGRELLMQAIQGNRSAIDQIASALNCSTTQLQNAICNVQGAIDKVAGQVGMTSQAVINAVQQQGCEIGNQISSCCCNLSSLINQSTCQTQGMITQQGFDNQLRTLEQTNILQNGLNQGLANNREQATSQFNILSAKLDAQTVMINDKFCQLEMREMQNTIAQLREEKAALTASALSQQQTQNIVGQLRPCPVKGDGKESFSFNAILVKQLIETFEIMLQDIYSDNYKLKVYAGNCIAQLNVNPKDSSESFFDVYDKDETKLIYGIEIGILKEMFGI